MKTVSIDSILIICFACVFGDSDMKTSAKFNSLIGSNKPHLISFNSDGGDIDVSWDISVPFFKIPINRMKENGEASPLINVNTRGLSIAGILTMFITLGLPFLSKSTTGTHYRSDSRTSRMEHAINEVIFGNNYLTPCVQRVVCTVVSQASYLDNSTDKIIDGLMSHKWFGEFINGTLLQEAVSMGRKVDHNCAHIYNKCFITSKMFKNLMLQIGLI